MLNSSRLMRRRCVAATRQVGVCSAMWTWRAAFDWACASDDPSHRERCPGRSFGGVRDPLLLHWPSRDSAGMASSSDVVAGILRHPLGAATDGAIGLQSLVSLVRRARY